MSLAQVRKLLAQYGLKPRKKLGQHFLVDEQFVERILSAAQLTLEDVVIEVGPGLGILTKELVKKAKKVIAVELDSKLAARLKQSLVSFSNLTVLNADILQVAISELVGGISPVTTKYKVVANPPYYITSPVLRHFLEASLKPCLMVVMLQKEVGEAIVAESGKGSLLSISVQFYGKPEIVAYVPSRAFYPVPKVDSVILRVEVYSRPRLEVSDVAGFFGIVKAGFASPRKQLRNSLAIGLDLPSGEVTLLLEKAGIEPQRRAETLSLEEWWQVWRSCESLQKVKR